MATDGPDPRDFRSWEEAFQYPVPTIRGMERQLRRDIESNREKLRTLVGYAKTFSSGPLSNNKAPIYRTAS